MLPFSLFPLPGWPEVFLASTLVGACFSGLSWVLRCSGPPERQPSDQEPAPAIGAWSSRKNPARYRRSLRH